LRRAAGTGFELLVEVIHGAGGPEAARGDGRGRFGRRDVPDRMAEHAVAATD
jgi:hypothetical protein